MIDIPFKAEVDIGDGAKSLKALKQEFKDAQKELDGLNVGTKEYVNTLQKLGGIKDKIGDLNQEINAFHPEGKIQAVTTVVGGLASGFQAATGAAALFGGESENLQKALLKVQAVMAFTEGLKGLTSLGDSFKVLINVLKSTALGQKVVTAAQWLWNAALNANPIGVVIIALTALVAGIKLFVSATDDAVEKQKRLNELEKEHAEIIELSVDAIKKKLIISVEASERELALMKANGAKIEEIHAKEQDIIRQKQFTLSYINGFRGKLNEEELKDQLDNLNQTKINDANYLKQKEENAKKEIKTQDDKNKLASEKKKTQDDEDWKAAELEAERRSQLEIDHIKIDTDLKIKLAERHRDAETKSAQEAKDEAGKMYDEDVENKKKANEAKEKLNKQYFENSVAQEQATMQLIQTVTDIYFQYKFARTRKDSAEELELKKKQFKINKAYQLAQTAIDGARAAINASGQHPYFYVGLSASIVASIATTAAIAKIAATKFDGGGGGSSGGGGGFAITGSPNTSPPPQINPPTSGNTQLNPDGTIKSLPQQPQQFVKAIVVETDVTDTQKRVSMIETNAKL